ncbi:putative transporter slc-17.2 [Halotydeus destructor]|nr:putative transporter slc-17.2 [Halotydeus destructor]
MAVPLRYIVVFMTLMAATVDYLTRVNINVAMVAMVSENSSTADGKLHEGCPVPEFKRLAVNQTIKTYGKGTTAPTYDWDEKTQGVILGTFFYSYVFMQVPSARLAEVFGGKWIVAFNLLASGLINLVTPIFASSAFLLSFSRVMLGFVQGGIFPACFAIVCKWLPANERGPGLALFDTGSNIGSVSAMFLAGYLSDHGFAGGWPSVFYTCGLVAMVLFIFWCLIVRSSPESHPWISASEMKKIKDGDQETLTPEEDEADKPAVPWCKMLTNKAVLSAIFLRFSWGIVFQVLQTKLPRYLNDVLHFPHTKNGLINGLLYASIVITTSTSGLLAAKIIKNGWLSRNNTRKMFAILSRVGTSACLIAIPFAGCDQVMVIGLLLCSMLMYGLASGCDIPLPAEMCTRFPATVYSIMNMGSSSAGFVSPYVVGLILESGDDVQHLWNVVFFLTAGVAMLGCVVFLIFGSSERQAFDYTAKARIPLS